MIYDNVYDDSDFDLDRHIYHNEPPEREYAHDYDYDYLSPDNGYDTERPQS